MKTWTNLPRLALSLTLAGGLLAACGDDAGDDDDDTRPPDGGPDVPVPDGGVDGGRRCGTISAAPRVFPQSGIGIEGQPAWVLSLDARPGDDFSCAMVEPDPAFFTIGFATTKCNSARCGVVISLPDIRPNGFRGSGVLLTPEFRDQLNIAVVSTVGAGRGPVSLAFNYVDEFDSTDDAEIVARAPVQVVSRLRIFGDTRFTIGGEEPFRLLSMGGGVFAGTFDASARGNLGVAGGADGGPPFGPGGGPGGGGATEGAAGGGAGHVIPGDPSDGAQGGPAYGDPFATCALEHPIVDCGGSGGGGGAGPGGGGGGTIFIASLGDLDLEGASLLAGGDAVPEGTGGGGGGGGSGGHVVVTARSWTPPAEIDVLGAPGANSALGTGGAGSAGRVRVDVPGETFAGATVGLTVEVSDDPASFLVEDGGEDIVIRGSAEPGSIVCATDIVRVREESLTIPEAMTCARQFVGEDGLYEIPIRLRPGLNRFRVQSGSDTAIVQSWNGNNIIIENSYPVAATLDYVYVPDFE